MSLGRTGRAHGALRRALSRTGGDVGGPLRLLLREPLRRGQWLTKGRHPCRHPHSASEDSPGSPGLTLTGGGPRTARVTPGTRVVTSAPAGSRGAAHWPRPCCPWPPPSRPPLTVVIVPGQVLRVDEQVVVGVQLPELAVDDVEVLVGEELRQLVDVRLLLQQRHVLQRTPEAAAGPEGGAGLPRGGPRNPPGSPGAQDLRAGGSTAAPGVSPAPRSPRPTCPHAPGVQGAPPSRRLCLLHSWQEEQTVRGTESGEAQAPPRRSPPPAGRCSCAARHR